MNERVKGLLKELGEAINESVSGSVRIDSIMQAIRDSGYEVYMTLEANIAVEDKHGRGEDEAEEDRITTDDIKFLQRLKIQY